ncbi:uncharacterized protein CANTADRAFT_242190 [Suhomyces tanzawaensis NRRL Y-17324]|uniref:Uncharacterized protein n=1 Tax=Suhomyces tanzawaensis NRRL Y-17324 TaxID=984487 RepID=A0A1E4SHG1_9ASCO|nr:uncharacterized protein CANTADRAFT_242190 [Suhomyces tanzawaensis NRRL Y-17324]ODV78948.1 hypothetical protein CANTADRAFT_242190 [Suhomyces tanzawaensis NRRL Y-17324]
MWLTSSASAALDCVHRQLRMPTGWRNSPIIGCMCQDLLDVAPGAYNHLKLGLVIFSMSNCHVGNYLNVKLGLVIISMLNCHVVNHLW